MRRRKRGNNQGQPQGHISDYCLHVRNLELCEQIRLNSPLNTRLYSLTGKGEQFNCTCLKVKAWNDGAQYAHSVCHNRYGYLSNLELLFSSSFVSRRKLNQPTITSHHIS